MFNLSSRQLIVSGVIVGLSLLLTVALSVKSGVFAEHRPPVTISEPAENVLPQTDHVAVSIKAVPTEGIYVHVAGKVKSPGVYRLLPGSRVNDAIKAAGGELPNADLDSLNLAQKLSDGEQVFVARIGKTPPAMESTVRGMKSEADSPPRKQGATGEMVGERRPSVPKLSVPGKGMVSINTADLNGLQRLPGIGPAMAQRVLDYRKQNGGFKSIEELQEIRGIGPVKFERLRPFVQL